MDYQRLWRDRHSHAHFVQQICDAWISEYLSEAGADPEDLVAVDPGKGFNYIFDLAGSLRGTPAGRVPRVIGVWGVSQPAGGRDHSRMRGHPRPARYTDDRGHLIAHTAGGGYDINLVPMDAALNRGWSGQGSVARPGAVAGVGRDAQKGSEYEHRAIHRQ